MTHYELMMILDPSIGENALSSSITGVKNALEESGAKITEENIWGEKKLAYKLHGSERGYYTLFQLELDGKKIKKLNDIINLDKNIWRYMFVNLEA